MRYLITGGCGFLGSNLAREVLRQGHELVILDNLSRLGSSENADWLRAHGSFKLVTADVRYAADVDRCVIDYCPDVVFHLAGQVAMTTSIVDPRSDFETNVLGGFNILEAIRRYAPDAIVTYSSTNKVYGDLEWMDYYETPTRYSASDYPSGFSEALPLEFRSPYGCSKGTVDQYMQDYSRVFGLKTVVFRHSSMYGGRQFSTADQGWIGWFCEQALRQSQVTHPDPFTISGSGKQVRDLLHADDMIDLYFSAVHQISRAAGQVFNIGGGIANSMSLLELFSWLEGRLSRPLVYRQLPPRESDQKVFVADVSKAQRLLEWCPRVTMNDGLDRMMEWVGR